MWSGDGDGGWFLQSSRGHMSGDVGTQVRPVRGAPPIRLALKTCPPTGDPPGRDAGEVIHCLTPAWCGEGVCEGGTGSAREVAAGMSTSPWALGSPLCHRADPLTQARTCRHWGRESSGPFPPFPRPVSPAHPHLPVAQTHVRSATQKGVCKHTHSHTYRHIYIETHTHAHI